MPLTKIEYYILKGTDFDYDFIGRDKDGHVYLKGYAGKLCISCYDHLFKTIENGHEFDILILLRVNGGHEA